MNQQVVVILLSAAFTGAAALGCGLALLRGLRVELRRGEAPPLAFVLGCAVLSAIVFLLCALWAVGPYSFGAVGVGAIAAGIVWRPARGERLPSVGRGWRVLLALGFVVFGLYTLTWGLAPETSPDGTQYHLGTVGRWFRAGGFEWHTTNMYANMPMGVEMLFLFAYTFGRHSAAALVHWQFLAVLAWLLLNAGKRFGAPQAGAIAALLVFMSPVVDIDAASAYVDVATAATVFAAFYAMLSFERTLHRGWMLAGAVLAGQACASKMTAFPAPVLAALFTAWVLWRSGRAFLRPALVVAAVAGAMIVPWMAKSALMVGNPFSPFLNRWFPNPYVRISFEEGYREYLRSYGGAVKSWVEIPRAVTIDGGSLNGLLGPVFLLAPIGLLAVRWPLGRRLVLAAVPFLATYPSNIGTRFLLTPLPFVALAMGLVLDRWRGMGPAVVLFHGVLSLPPVITFYSNRYAWRLESLLWQQALRIEPEDTYLRRWAAMYPMARLIEERVPEWGKVLTFGSVAEAYTSRDILVAYQAGFNSNASDVLSAGAMADYQPVRAIEFRVPPVETRRFRIVQTASVPEMWSVTEVRVFEQGGAEIRRAHTWRVKAAPNRWDVQLAFDNCPATRWRGWEPARPGQSIEVDFGRPHIIETVRVEASPDQRTTLRLEWESSPGIWDRAGGQPVVSGIPAPPNPRRTATAELKRLGITHLAINKDDFIAQDLAHNVREWGLTIEGDTALGTLYRID